jgi:hypothetical protein
MNLLKDHPFPEPVEDSILVVLLLYGDGSYNTKLFESKYTENKEKLNWIYEYSYLYNYRYQNVSERTYWSLINKNSNVTT